MEGLNVCRPGLEVVPAAAELEVTPVDGLNVFYDRSNEKYTVVSDVATPESQLPEPASQRKPRVWRRRKATFWLTVALLVSLIVIIVVAVVAGIMVSKNNKQKGELHANLQYSHEYPPSVS